MTSKLIAKLKRLLSQPNEKFDATGERVDITYSGQINFDELDMYQKSHLKRYQYVMEVLKPEEVCGDFACGTGYGTAMLSTIAKKIIGIDFNGEVISAVRKRYAKLKNLEFVQGDLLNLNYESTFDTLISFETIEHFSEENIPRLLALFYKAIKPGGKFVFSTPYMQEKSEAAIKLGHHLTFYIDEKKVKDWLTNAGFSLESCMYQNYETHDIQTNLDKKDFLICMAKKS